MTVLLSPHSDFLIFYYTSDGTNKTVYFFLTDMLDYNVSENTELTEDYELYLPKTQVKVKTRYIYCRIRDKSQKFKLNSETLLADRQRT